jgi:hypothetical protein
LPIPSILWISTSALSRWPESPGTIRWERPRCGETRCAR